MLIKIYEITWVVFGLVTVGLLAAGMMTQMVMVILGFVAFALVFGGMVGVLPASVGHNAPH